MLFGTCWPEFICLTHKDFPIVKLMSNLFTALASSETMGLQVVDSTW